MHAARPCIVRDRDLCRRPARLTQAMDINGTQDGIDLIGAQDGFTVIDDGMAPPKNLAGGPRIGISLDKDLPWRWSVSGNRYRLRNEADVLNATQDDAQPKIPMSSRTSSAASNALPKRRLTPANLFVQQRAPRALRRQLITSTKNDGKLSNLEKQKTPDFSGVDNEILALSIRQNGISSSSKLLLPAGADGAGARWP